MDALNRLRQAWSDATRRLGADPRLSDLAFADIAAGYGGPDRHYHGLAHIAALLDLAAAHRALVRDPVAIDLAIIFHDAVYDPRRSDNEEASARLAEGWLPRLQAPAELTGRVARYVRATAHGLRPDEPKESDLAFLLDIDLSILASGPSAYRAYADAIRREYAHIAPDRFRQGRARILRQFLMRDRIYQTPHLHQLWEAVARANLAAELAVIDNGSGVAPAG